MNSKMNRLRVVGGASVAALAASALVPTTALAASTSGADLLIPKPAEFIPALVAFVIIWVIMAKVAWPSVLGMMDKRQQKIKDDLDAAAESKVKAAEEAKEYEAKLLSAQKEADAIVAQAKKEAEEERSQILAKAQTDASDIVAKARGVVDSERKKAMIELSSSVVDLSVDIAGKIIGNDMSDEEQRKLAKKYLAEVSTPNER